MAGKDETVYDRILLAYIWPRNQTYALCILVHAVASASAVIGSVFMRKFIFLLGQCIKKQRR